MTTDQPSFDDLQLSAALDGDLEPELASRIDQDAEARLRLDQLRAARDLVAAAGVTPLPEQEVDRLIATAVVATDATAPGPGAAGDPDGPTPPVVAPPSGRRPDPVPAWLVAAVVVVLVGIGLALVYTGRDDGTDVAFDTVGQSISGASDATAGADDGGSASLDAPDAAASATAESDPAEDPPATTAAGEEAGTTGTAPELVPLGAFVDADALREHLRAGFPAPDPEAPPATETDVDAAFRCLGKIDAMFGTGSEPVHVGLATLAGEATVVYELPYRADDGRDTTLVVAVGELTCIPSLSFQR